jgi:hypothetical protein
MSASRRILLGASLLIASFSRAALAGPPVPEPPAAPSDDPKATAKAEAAALANEAFTAYEAGKFEAAERGFRAAELKYHAPTFMLYRARCEAKLGKLAQAKQVYRAMVDEKLASYAPAEFFTAQKSAQQDLDALLPRVPVLRILVHAPPGVTPQVMLDDVEIGAAMWGQPIDVDPGTHRVVRRMARLSDDGRNVDVQEAGSEVVTFEMDPGARTVAAVDAPKKVSGTEGPLWPAMAAFGVGAVGLGIGAGTGAAALGHMADIKRLCPGGGCATPDAQSEYTSTRTLGTASTVAFIVGGIGAAAGITLLVLRPFGAPITPSAPSTQVSVGPSSVQWTRTF